MTGSVVRIQHAHKFYNKGRPNQLHVMDDVTLELPASGLVAIFGKSGCGKTTLLNAVGGLDKIASGSIELFGQSLGDRRAVDGIRNRYVGYIFQNYNLNVNETVYDNVAAALRLCGMEDEGEITERVTAALRNVGMDKYVSRTPDTLSGGQQQRVAIARALVKNPAIILADEPTGNLDEANTVLVMDILKEISKTHLVLLVTHEAHLVDYYCDRVIEIVDGRIQNDRRNEGANGYVRRNKNDIFLGELEKSETVAPGVTLTAYGEISDAAPIGLTLVRVDGKLYLTCDDPSVKWLDEGSEIRLREGVFDETLPHTDNAEDPNGHAIDMSRLTPLSEGSHYGRLYRMKNALSQAWVQNFHRPRRANGKKKGRGLRAVLVVLAIVLGFMSSTIGVGIKQYSEISRKHNDRIFYIPLDPAVDYAGLDIAAGHNGVTHSRIIGSSPEYDLTRLSFGTAAFMTAKQVEIAMDGYAQSVETMPPMPLVAGTDRIGHEQEILITTAMADELIGSSTVSYIDDYRDLVGMVTTRIFYGGMPERLRIVGVLESTEAFFYMDAVALSRFVLASTIGMDAVALSETRLGLALKDGELAYIHWLNEGEVTESLYKVGDTVTVMGRVLTVGAVVPCLYDEGERIGMEDAYYGFVLTDNDFRSLAYRLDQPPEGEMPFYQMWDWGYGDEPSYSNHLQIRSSDPAATEAYLTTALGADGFLSPAELLEAARSVARFETMMNALVMLFFIALMCLCVFFIMRASFMSRVREVGILRAIGVTRKNLVFRFGVETGMLLLFTTVLAYLCTSVFVMSLADAPLFGEMFFFPPWLAVGLLLLIVGAGIFFGILPALILLRKTPSEILAKYDI